MDHERYALALQMHGIITIPDNASLRTAIAKILGPGTYRSFELDGELVMMTVDYIRQLVSG